MTLKKYTPSLQLQPYIKCYYLMESDYPEDIKDVFFADGCVEVVFHLGLEFYRGEEKECWAKIIGQITQPLTMKAKGKGKSFGIWFLPHAFSMFSGIPIYEFNDKAVPLDTIFSNAFIDFVGNCLFENDLEGLLAGIDRYLIAIMQISSNSTKENLIDYAVRYILKYGGQPNLNTLVKDCNISNRYLQKIFIEKVGFSPKFFMRIVRFQQVLHYLSDRQFSSLTSVAYQADYYDQAHFIRDFKDFTGFTPSRFQLKKHPINQYFLNL